MKTKLLTSSLILLLAGSSLARTWTSSDGSKTFESDFGKAFKKLQKLDGKSFAKHELECAPEFFILYFSASW